MFVKKYGTVFYYSSSKASSIYSKPPNIHPSSYVDGHVELGFDNLHLDSIAMEFRSTTRLD